MRLFTRGVRYGVSALTFSLSAGIWLDAQALSEKDFLGDLPVVLSASRLAQPKQDAPAAITVIDRAQIEASPALEIVDLLRLVPGYQVGLVSGSERSITSHGLADQLGRRMQVLVDGRSVYDPFLGGALWQSLPISLSDVERIEVVRGPNAAAFGANAFQGAINIVTRAPGATPETRANVLAGSLGTRRVHATRDWVAGRHRLQLNLGFDQDDGFPDRHDDIRSTQFNVRVQSQLTPRDRLDIQLGGRESDVELGYAGDAFQPERSTGLLHHYQQLTWERFLDDGSDLRLQFYHTYQNNKDAYLYPPVFTIDRSFVSQRTDAELQWRFSPSDSSRVVLGAGWRLDQGNDALLLDPLADNSRTQLRFFVHGEQRLGRNWLLQGGLMAEDFEEVGRYVSPRVSLNYRFLPRHAARLSAARGYRIPSLFEQEASFRFPPWPTPYFVSAEGVKAERITAYELGLVGAFVHPNLSYDLKLFHHTMEDLIFPAQNLGASQWEFRNSGILYLLGLELGLHAQPTPRTEVDLAYSLADASGHWLRRYTPGVPIDPDTDTRNARPEVPRHTIGLMVSQRFSPNWMASLLWSYADYVEWLGEGDRIKPHQRLDMKISRELRVSGSRVRLELISQNVFNKGFYDFNIASPPNPGNLFERRIYGQVVISR